RVINQELPSPLSDISLGILLKPNYGGFLRKSLTFPLRVAGVARELLGHLNELSAVDLATGLVSGLPTGIYTGAGIENYVAEALSDPHRSNDFRLLAREFYLPATDLYPPECVVCGQDV